jgi:hypothetical protein
MAHFAKLNDKNVVIDVNAVSNDCLDAHNEEASGIAFLTEWSGGHTNWVQTSYSANYRFNYAGIGFTYDPIDDAFIPPMPNCGHDELLLNANKQWECDNAAHVVIAHES